LVDLGQVDLRSTGTVKLVLQCETVFIVRRIEIVIAQADIQLDFQIGVEEKGITLRLLAGLEFRSMRWAGVSQETLHGRLGLGRRGWPSALADEGRRSHCPTVSDFFQIILYYDILSSNVKRISFRTLSLAEPSNR
jgi:hypothetical protein